MEPFMFDVSAFFGEPKPNEQTSDVIVDPRKHLKTVKMINTPTKHVKQSTGGACKFGSGNGGALAFNEDQLMNDLSNLKKGGS